MAYIIKNTSGLINTRLTDAARQKISQGKFNISYFQIGDSEVTYNALPNTYNQANTYILEPNFNSQNTSGVPQSNKQNVKYPYYVDGITGNTYGIPYMDSIVSPVYNRAPLRGFFIGNITAETINWSALTNNQYVINSNYVVDMSTLTCSATINLIYAPCNPTSQRGILVGDLITIFYDGKGIDDCSCINLPTPTPTTTLTPTPSSGITTTPTPTPTKPEFECSPNPTPTPTKTPCETPLPKPPCPPPTPPDCKVSVDSCHVMLTYRVIDVCNENKITLDRPTPDFSWLNDSCYARILVYPSSMTEIYDSYTPRPHWADDVINYESICDIDQFDVKVWNMNIPWSENPAGLQSNISKDYTTFGSIGYLGTKEYLGYASSSGNTDTDSTYYYNSFSEQVIVTPEEQKTIAVIHYTNQTIDFFYGEKFALENFDPSNTDDTTGQARNFKLHIPWLMWHKNENCCDGQTFWVDPPDFEKFNLFQVNYIESTKNVDMNSPGIRYYHLWDTNPNLNGVPNRIGKVFPDQKIVVIDDEEIVAAMSYKSNRNWTLPAPKISLITPNICGLETTSAEGLLSAKTQYLHVTYVLTDTNTCLTSLHCNYYTIIQGPNIDCLPITSQNVGVRFGDEFPCLIQPNVNPVTTTTTTINPNCKCWQINSGSLPVTASTTTCEGDQQIVTISQSPGFVCSTTTPESTQTITVVDLGLCSEVTQCGGTTTTTTQCPEYCNVESGFYANKFEIICQVVDGNSRPSSSEWKKIDFTDQLSATTINGYITKQGLTNNTFVITKELYDDALVYNLDDYIPLVPVGYTGTSLNFGDEYYFYGSLESDIQATIYEMRYKINLGQSEFQTSSNPTHTQGTKSYVSEIGLYDSDKTLMIVSKLQSPVLRQGIQQFLVKLDF